MAPETAEHQHGDPVDQPLTQRRSARAEGAAERQKGAGDDGDDQAAQDVARPALEQAGKRHQAFDLGPQTARKPAAAKRTM